ncbi:MAG: hypothetical protein IMZ44_23640 [Planctomycetes bacterium]|nr:hypothetical protein [Planctomycetota bacterium]
MTRARNADDFFEAYRNLRARYDEQIAPWLRELRHRYADPRTGALPPSLNEELEWHRRAYFIDSLLAALNWHIVPDTSGQLPNLVPEMQVKSSASGRTRRLDYLGLENETKDPLIIVETKRRCSPLAELADLGAVGSAGAVPENIGKGLQRTPRAIAETLGQALNGRPLKGKWNKWLATLVDYVRSVTRGARRPPKRVVVTDGDWLIIFTDPADAFLDGGQRKASAIEVYQLARDGGLALSIEEASQVFLLLDYFQVLGEIGPLLPEELPFYLARTDVDRIMYGLRIHYIDKQTTYGHRIPEIRVAPAVLIRSKGGSWFDVEAQGKDHVVPDSESRLAEHLRDVGRDAKALLGRAKSSLKMRRRPTDVVDHYHSHVAFKGLGGVKRLPDTGDLRTEAFLMATGAAAHYLKRKPSVAACPFHDHEQCRRQNAPDPSGPILTPSTNPRCFFVSGQDHHCAHGGVCAAKAHPVNESNRSRCGLRSAEDGQAFCETYRFETHLCCRTCVLEEVCASTQILPLPCISGKARH